MYISGHIARGRIFLSSFNNVFKKKFHRLLLFRSRKLWQSTKRTLKIKGMDDFKKRKPKLHIFYSLWTGTFCDWASVVAYLLFAFALASRLRLDISNLPQ